MIDLNEVKKRARILQPIVQIGKNGLTDGSLLEINRQLKAKKIIKIRFLRSALGKVTKSSLTKEIVSKTGAVPVDQMGLTLVLLKNKEDADPAQKKE